MPSWTASCCFPSAVLGGVESRGGPKEADRFEEVRDWLEVNDFYGTAQHQAYAAIVGLQERGEMFVGPGVEVYEGMIVGENSRDNDLDVNIVREKKLTNMRSSTADVFETLAKPIDLDLERAMEFCASDECVEVTPEVVRVRKVELDATSRARSRARAKARG